MESGWLERCYLLKRQRVGGAWSTELDCAHLGPGRCENADEGELCLARLRWPVDSSPEQRAPMLNVDEWPIGWRMHTRRGGGNQGDVSRCPGRPAVVERRRHVDAETGVRQHISRCTQPRGYSELLTKTVRHSDTALWRA
ncbi:unnamed protein product [Protopolystoma xenopodis]|uniref:Uncharacterized protein n=1 Tax=Protopolystoma xenopodis TaxID=117903 RepID=A0A448WD09_9PLAT|nr:unnamed protein product [Protopolystoma xenopodis]